MHPLNIWNGIEVITSVYLTVSREQTVRRTWRERLWSWPWRPWVLTRVVIVEVPSPEVRFIGQNKMVMHPETLRVLRASLSPHDIAARQSADAAQSAFWDRARPS